jgi:hypothetical protein
MGEGSMVRMVMVIMVMLVGMVQLMTTMMMMMMMMMMIIIMMIVTRALQPTLVLPLAEEMVWRQFLSTMANFLPSVGSCKRATHTANRRQKHRYVPKSAGDARISHRQTPRYTDHRRHMPTASGGCGDGKGGEPLACLLMSGDSKMGCR